MEPWQSWALMGAVCVGVYWYYSSQHQSKRGQGRTAALSYPSQRRDSILQDETKGKRKKGNLSGTTSQSASDVADVSSASLPTSGNDRLKKRKGGKQQLSQLGQSSAVEINKDSGADMDSSNAKESDIDNKELARQIASLKTGTSLNRPTGTNETKRTRKQGKRNEMLAEPTESTSSKANALLGAQAMSTASSTTGADADDDLSPVMSPEFGATAGTGPAGGVSDMLEVTSKGPSVLRLTEAAVSQPARQPKPQKQAPEPESKKQRQNRQRNEEKKFARDEAEKARRVLLEKQLRTAREAEGRPAKDGSASSKPPSTNAWTNSSNASMPMVPDVATRTGLLDTFDEPTAVANDEDQRPAKGTSGEQNKWGCDLPSEEEQMRMLSELDNDGWNTVEKGGKGKKKAMAKAENSEAILPASGHEQTEAPGNKPQDKTKTTAINAKISAKPKSAASKSAGTDGEPPKRKTTKEDVDPKIWNRSNIHLHPDYNDDYPYALTGHPDDDEWAVI